MEQKILLFECVGIKDSGVFPLANTGRGRDVSPEFVWNRKRNSLNRYKLKLA